MVHISFESEPWMDSLIQSDGVNGLVAQIKEFIMMKVACRQMIEQSRLQSVDAQVSAPVQVNPVIQPVPAVQPPPVDPDRTCPKCAKVLPNKKGLANHRRTCVADLVADQAMYNKVMEGVTTFGRGP